MGPGSSGGSIVLLLPASIAVAPTSMLMPTAQPRLCMAVTDVCASR
jgi:hypothetical protein